MALQVVSNPHFIPKKPEGQRNLMAGPRSPGKDDSIGKTALGLFLVVSAGVLQPQPANLKLAEQSGGLPGPKAV